MTVLYDGWQLAYAPNSPAALHLLALLEVHETLGTPAAIGLPAASFHPTPPGMAVHVRPTASTGRLGWEQHILPELATQLSGATLHSVGGGLALLRGRPGLSSPAGFDSLTPARLGLRDRLRLSLGQGGQARAITLWPSDQPTPAGESARLGLLPPLAPRCFHQTSDGCPPGKLDGLDLPQSYVLYHGPEDETRLRRVLDAWTWVAGSMGEYYPLLAVGLSEIGQRRFDSLVAEYRLSGTARPLPSLSLASLAALYHGCSLLFHPVAPSVWGDPLRLALAAGRPIVSAETPAASSMLGPAAYLAPAADARKQGAAMLTVLVEESLAGHLASAALQRAQAWAGFGQAYHRLLVERA